MRSMDRIIDFHTHAFPDQVAARAVPALAKNGGVQAHLDGTVDALLASMDGAGIERSVVCSIATRAEQFESIFRWCQEIRSPRITPLPSVYPGDPQAVQRVEEIAAAGFAGIKLHPYYQDFYLADRDLDPLYQALSDHGLLAVVHTGFDIAFARERRCDPQAVLDVLGRFPKFKLICSHLGAWDDWHEVERLLIGRPIYMDISFSLPMLGQDRARRLLQAHSTDHILFGTDSPWEDQQRAIEDLRDLDLDPSLLAKIFHENACSLLSCPL